MDHDWPVPRGSSSKEAMVKCTRCGARLKLGPEFKDINGLMNRKVEELDYKASQPCSGGLIHM